MTWHVIAEMCARIQLVSAVFCLVSIGVQVCALGITLSRRNQAEKLLAKRWATVKRYEALLDERQRLLQEYDFIVVERQRETGPTLQ